MELAVIIGVIGVVERFLTSKSFSVVRE